MDKGTRIRVIQRVRDALTSMTWEDQDLILSTFEVGELPDNPYGDGPTLTQWLNSNITDQQLHALAQHLEVLDNEAQPMVNTPTTETSESLFIFASHLSTHRELLGHVARELQLFHVDMFVAHDSIAMDAPWEHAIVEALNRCHAGAAFIHPGLHDSFYCMQEIGWMLGRGVPIARLLFGEAPKGLLGNLQGKPLANKTAQEVSEALLDWAGTHANLAGPLAESLTLALENSRSFNHTDRIWERLKGISELTPRQLERVIHAAELNNQVYGASEMVWGGRPYRHAIADGAEKWDCDGTQKTRIAALRGSSAGPIVPSPTGQLKKSQR
ncbi:hypothetical protein [Micrococcus terreus]|uniref:hypothetical protein n=1 Tax=Micrococcus terreus TaxID=574650 RepID=UPI0023F78251|nr:hypothetical protein [Micrococcus terreus]